MTISDESGNGTKPKPNWPAIRREYETSRVSQRKLAAQHGISASTLMQRAMRDKWSQRGKLVAKAAAALEADIDAKTLAIVRDELAPFIEQEKTKITKRGVRIGNRGLTRIEKLWRGSKPTDAKAEADAARAVETFIKVGRVSLGMNDDKPVSGIVSLRVLAGSAAIQVNQGTPEAA